MTARYFFLLLVVSPVFATEVPKEFTFVCQTPDATQYYLILATGEKALVIEKAGGIMRYTLEKFEGESSDNKPVSYYEFQPQAKDEISKWNFANEVSVQYTQEAGESVVRVAVYLNHRSIPELSCKRRGLAVKVKALEEHQEIAAVVNLLNENALGIDRKGILLPGARALVGEALIRAAFRIEKKPSLLKVFLTKMIGSLKVLSDESVAQVSSSVPVPQQQIVKDLFVGAGQEKYSWVLRYADWIKGGMGTKDDAVRAGIELFHQKGLDQDKQILAAFLKEVSLAFKKLTMKEVMELSEGLHPGAGDFFLNQWAHVTGKIKISDLRAIERIVGQMKEGFDKRMSRNPASDETNSEGFTPMQRALTNFTDSSMFHSPDYKAYFIKLTAGFIKGLPPADVARFSEWLTPEEAEFFREILAGDLASH